MRLSSRRRLAAVPLLILTLAGSGCREQSRPPAAPPQAARPRANVVQTENAKPGTTEWLLGRPKAAPAAGSDAAYQRMRGIEGYVSHTSIRGGETLTAYVSVSPPAPYRVLVFRMGHYQGTGARLMTALGPLAGTPQAEPVELEQQLVEARWQPSFRLPIPSHWPSGVYLAKLTREDTGAQSYLIWVVRDDRKADLMLQVSDLTWQAYNRWPGWRSLYDWKDEQWRTVPGAKVGFDRPYSFYYNKLPVGWEPLTNGSGEFLLWEFPLVYWLEANGYDVTYVSNIDTHADAAGLRRVKGFLSVGHDEYWSRTMVENVTRARDAGVSLAFLSGNAVDGEITLGHGTDGRPNRVFERFRGRGEDDDFADEQQLIGAASYGVGLGDWTVTDAGHWLFAGTGMKSGDRIPGLVGWEYHGPPFRKDPALAVVARGPVHDAEGKLQKPEFAATIYQLPRGNVVFNAATCWWNMLLSRPPGFVNPNGRDFTRSDPRVQRITRNLLMRMIR
jgi:hypothetical protein